MTYVVFHEDNIARAVEVTDRSLDAAIDRASELVAYYSQDEEYTAEDLEEIGDADEWKDALKNYGKVVIRDPGDEWRITIDEARLFGTGDRL